MITICPSDRKVADKNRNKIHGRVKNPHLIDTDEPKVRADQSAIKPQRAYLNMMERDRRPPWVTMEKLFIKL